jgi:Na+/melibiose symporter-like transporter
MQGKQERRNVVLFGLAFLLSAFGYEFMVFVMTVMNVRPAIMTEILPKDNYLHGNAIMLVSLNAARLAAPLIGGVVALKWNIALLLHLTAVVYVAAALLGLATRLAPMPQRASRSTDTVFAHMREGALYLLANRDLRYLGTVAFLWRLCLSCQLPLFVVYVKQFLGKGSDGYGIFMTMAGVGSVLGSVLGPRLAGKFDRKKLILWGLALVSLAVLQVKHASPVPARSVTTDGSPEWRQEQKTCARTVARKVASTL